MPLENTISTDAAAPDSEPVSGKPPASLFELLDDIEPASPESASPESASPEPASTESASPEGAPEQELPPTNEAADKPETPPTLFNELAETSGLELNDLYQLKVTTANGEQVSIEELKATQAKHDDIVLRELEFEENRSTKEGALRQAQNELAEIVAGLPDGTLQPAVLEKLRERNAQKLTSERAKTLESIPAWKDNDKREADIAGMAAHLQRFGYPADYLASVVDHRQLTFIRESFLREQRIKNALKKVRAGAPNPTTPTRAPGRSPRKGQRRKDNNARNGLETFFSNLN